MTVGVGGKRRQDALGQLTDMTAGVSPILEPEFQERIERLQRSLKASGVQAIYLHASTNLFYFTGLRWSPSERMVAAVIPAEGDLFYIAPNFELDTLRDYWMFEAPIVGWHEHESPYESFHAAMLSRGITDGTILVDEATPFYTVTGLCDANPEFKFELGQSVTQALRSIKTAAEIEIIQRAHEMTLAVLKSAASILEPGITTTEVETFIDEAHRKVGAPAGSYFCIVLFGVATSFPHGVKDPQVLKPGDWVLMDTGCVLHEYISDITRSFCFGEPTDDHRAAWAAEKRAQLAAFAAAGTGVACEDSDAAARASLVESGFGPDYELPGLPHRTGHGCGLDIHEGPNLVRGEGTKMAVGMVFSNEPMLVIPDKFGVRLEDHFYLTAKGPQWFTQPSESIDDPFAS
ncbi:Xaa-Pro peptidase family protein [Mariniblastus sp.]|nr:Xaa-Pro peptidase family protein [Mariniblastus sp.]MDA7925547.1 Xaa-Pro peptidase family protein [Mariniblastus sp.]